MTDGDFSETGGSIIDDEAQPKKYGYHRWWMGRFEREQALRQEIRLNHLEQEQNKLQREHEFAQERERVQERENERQRRDHMQEMDRQRHEQERELKRNRREAFVWGLQVMFTVGLVAVAIIGNGQGWLFLSNAPRSFNSNPSASPREAPFNEPTVPKEFLPKPDPCPNEDCREWQLRRYGSELLFLIRAKKSLQEIERILYWFPELKNFKDIDKRTPFHMAYCYGNEEAASLLQDHRANIKVVDYFGNTPKDDYEKDHCKDGREAMNAESTSALDKVMLANDADMSLFLFMCQDGSSDMINAHLTKNPDDIVAQDFDGRSCLHILAKENRSDLVKQLVKKAGNRPFMNVDRYQRTPYNEAVLNGHTKIAEYLKQFKHVDHH